MSGQAILTKDFAKSLRSLIKRGKPGKNAQLKALAAQAEHQNTGKIESIPRTKHGESRFPKAEKYDLGDGYRLVCQTIGGPKNVLAFLFVGDHQEADRWLENHRDYQWIRRKSDRTLELVQITKKEDRGTYTPQADLESPEDLLAMALLRTLSNEQWQSLRLPEEVQDYLNSVTAEDWERDANGIVAHVEQLADEEIAYLAADLFDQAHKREWEQLNFRIEAAAEAAIPVSDDAVADGMLNDSNCEKFIRFAELDQLPKNSTWNDWLLFLSPEQKRFSRQHLKGAARLRGVSGSGKTCVMLHRASHLARKYRKPILVVTLTESMRKLLDQLLDDLCGVERPLVTTHTIDSLAGKIIRRLDESANTNERLTPEKEADFVSQLVVHTRAHADFDQSGLRSFGEQRLAQFLRDEVSYVRSRLRRSEYSRYLDTKGFPRHGRGIPLNAPGRRMSLEAVELWQRLLLQAGLVDSEVIAQCVLELLELDEVGLKERGWTEAAYKELVRRSELSAQGGWYRSVLVDEVQDLSQIEISLLANLPINGDERVSHTENGVFLVGDGAQTIYKKGFNLRDCKLDVVGRSFALKKNYRNSRQIMQGSFALVRELEFAELDDEDMQRPLEPEYALRQGERPTIVRCSSLEDETEFVAKRIKQTIDDNRARAEASEHELSEPLQICVITPHPRSLETVHAALRREGVNSTDLTLDVAETHDTVKVSSIEAVKGHEFRTVFLVDIVDGVIPRLDITSEEFTREAARLYVAMTRAKDQLFISYTLSSEYGPSPFLLAILPHCDEYEFSNGELKSLDVDKDAVTPDTTFSLSDFMSTRFQTDGSSEDLGDGDSDTTLKTEDEAESSFEGSETALEESQSHGEVVEPPQVGSETGSLKSKVDILQAVGRREISIDDATLLLAEVERAEGGLRCKVSQKGALSVYGLQRLPVTLYVDQWERLLKFSDEIRRFAKEHEGDVKRKR